MVPDYVSVNHPGISSLAIGIMLASYQFVIFILAPVLGDKLSSIGRKRAIKVAFITLSLSTVVFAFASFCKTDEAFYTVSIVARSFQGATDAMILVTIPSTVAIEWPEKSEVYQGYVFAAMGIGCLLGPVITSCLMEYLDYFWTLIVFAALLLIFGMIATYFIPERLDFIAEDQRKIERIPYKVFLKNPRVLAVLFANFAASVRVTFLEPILVLRLDELGVSDDIKGLGFTLMAGHFTFGSAMIGGIAEKFGKQQVVIACSFMPFVSLWLLRGINSQPLVSTWVGLGMSGLFTSGPLVLPVPEIIESIELSMNREAVQMPDDHPDNMETDPLLSTYDSDVEKADTPKKLRTLKASILHRNISDKAAALTQIFNTLGSVLGNPIGGGLYDAIGWQDTCLVVAGLILFVAVTHVLQMCCCNGSR